MGFNEQFQLMQAIIEQQKAYIQMQEARMAEKDATIAELRKLVDELQSLKANLEETLKELRRQFFGISSEKTSASSKRPAPSSSVFFASTFWKKFQNIFGKSSRAFLEKIRSPKWRKFQQFLNGYLIAQKLQTFCINGFFLCYTFKNRQLQLSNAPFRRDCRIPLRLPSGLTIPTNRQCDRQMS